MKLLPYIGLTTSTTTQAQYPAHSRGDNMNKYAEVLYGKVQAVYEDERDFATWKNIFSPTTYWVDVTGQDCEVGYVVAYQEGVGVILKAPEEDTRTDAEKAIAILDAEYQTSKESIALAYIDAVMSDDTDTQTALKEDLVALNTDYDTQRAALEEE